MRRFFVSLLKYALLLVLVAALIIGLLFVYSRGLLPFGDPPTTINATIIRDRVQQLSNLTTTRYTYSSIITTSTQMPRLLQLLYGSQRVMVATGYVTAGVDMTQIAPEDVTLTDGALRIRLPLPTLQDCFLDEAATRVESTQEGVFAPERPNIDQETRQYAVRQFRDQALESGILAEAAAQARSVVEEFVGLVNPGSITTVEVTVAASADGTIPALPETCR